MGFFKKIKEESRKQKQVKKEHEELFEKGGSAYQFGSVEYLGGHYDIDNKMDGFITVNKDYIHFTGTLNNISVLIPIKNVKKTEFKTDEQISKDVTLTRLALFGFLAFGMKKKRKQVENYLLLTCEIEGLETMLVFRGKKAPNINSGILKAMIENRKNEASD